MEDMLLELEFNLSKLIVAPALSRYLTQAKTNTQGLKSLLSQLVNSGVFTSSSSSSSSSSSWQQDTKDYSSLPYWHDKTKQIVMVQSHWRGVLAQKKFLRLIASHPTTAKRLHRKRVLEEILSTEKTYVAGLRAGIEVNFPLLLLVLILVLVLALALVLARFCSRFFNFFSSRSTCRVPHILSFLPSSSWFSFLPDYSKSIESRDSGR
jgi:hypothetical protein